MDELLRWSLGLSSSTELIDVLDSRIAGLRLAVRRLDAAESAIERLLAGADRASSELCVLATGHATLEERFYSLETSVSAVVGSIFDSNSAVLGELSARFERLENDHFLLSRSEDRINTVSLVAASLNVSLVVTEIVCAFRIRDRISSSSPLIVRLANIPGGMSCLILSPPFTLHPSKSVVSLSNAFYIGYILVLILTFVFYSPCIISYLICTVIIVFYT